MSKPVFTKQQKEDYDEWAAHYETYQKWTMKKPQEHEMYNMSVKNIKRDCSVEYYRGFLEAIAHIIAVVQNSLETDQGKKDVDLKKTFSEYCHVLIGSLVEKNSKHGGGGNDNNNDNETDEEEEKDLSLLETAQKAIPPGKTKDFYVGFQQGCEQICRFVTTLYDEKQAIKEPFNVLKVVFIIQSGFVIGLMIENWPQHRRPSLKNKPS